MARGLMLDCENHGGTNCKPEVKRFALAQEHKDGEDSGILPIGPELEKLDAICEQCEFFKSQ